MNLSYNTRNGVIFALLAWRQSCLLLLATNQQITWTFYSGIPLLTFIPIIVLQDTTSHSSGHFIEYLVGTG